MLSRLRRVVSDDAGFVMPIWLLEFISGVTLVLGIFMGVVGDGWGVAGLGLIGLAWAEAWRLFWYLDARRRYAQFTRFGPVLGYADSREAPPPAWLPDPTQRHQQRFWGGTHWTEHVSDDGLQGVDSLTSAPTEQAHPSDSPSGVG